MPIRPYAEPPEIVTGYSLDGKWEVVIPPTVDCTNLVSNPSVEVDTTGYTAVGGSIARSSVKQRRGAYSLAVTPGAGTGDGVYFQSLTTVAGQCYPWSFDFWGRAGLQYEAWWTDTVGNALSGRVTVIGKDRWERVLVPYVEATGGARRLNVRKKSSAGSANTSTYYVDGMLVPSNSPDNYPWRYFDGDSVGFVFNQTDFYWNGTVQGSTSVMKAYSRAGGRLVPLADLGLVIQATLGLGLGTPVNLSMPLALPGGAQYQRTLAPARTFDLVGYIQGQSQYELDVKRNKLTAALDARRLPKSQQLILQYTQVDQNGDQLGEPVEIQCALAGGLEGVRDNHYQENLDLKFEIYVPVVGQLSGQEGIALNTRTSFTAGYVARRSAAGVWGALQTSGLNGGVVDILPMPNGQWLIGGQFTNAGGIANADYLAYYDPVTDTFSAVNATPLNNVVTALLLLPNGNVLVAGVFTNAGGDANADLLCLLTVSTGAYSAVNATPLNALPNDLALLKDGNVAIGGQFTNAGGDANADYLCKLTLSTGAFSSFTATLLNNFVNALDTTKDGTLYIGGNFTNVGGFAEQDYLAVMRYPYTGFSRVLGHSALSTQVLVIRALSDGSVLIGGQFVNVDGDSSWDYLLRSIMAPPGSTTEVPLLWSKPFSNIDNAVFAISEVQPGVVMVGGQFASVASVSLYDGIFQYAGTTIQPIDLDLPGAISVGIISARPSGEAIIGFLTTGTGYTSGATTVPNTGSAFAAPIIVLKYAAAATVVAKVYSIRNLSTGQIISLDIAMMPGERLTIDTARGTLTSDIRGNMNIAIIPGSNFTTFSLLPGNNALNIYVDIAAAANMTAYAYWTPQYAALSDAIS